MLTKLNHKLLRCIFSKLNNKSPDEYVGDIEIKNNSVNLTKDYICSDGNKLDEKIRKDLVIFSIFWNDKNQIIKTNYYPKMLDIFLPVTGMFLIKVDFFKMFFISGAGGQLLFRNCFKK